MTFVLGLTGSIGTGKSATAAMFGELGIPVHDADATVHALYRGDLVGPVEVAFPGTRVGEAIDRIRLAARVLGDDAALKRLEAIVHPAVRRAEDVFLRGAEAASAVLAVLDVPLLYEAGLAGRCDAVLVVTVPAAIQRERVLARPGMTPERFASIVARQMPDDEKRRRADFVVHTGGGFDDARRQVRAIVAALAGRPGHVLAARRERGGDT